MKSKAFRLTEQDCSNLSIIKETQGLPCEVDALRYALKLAADFSETTQNLPKSTQMVKIRKYSDEYINDWISKNGVGMPRVMCPLHTSTYIFSCGCITLDENKNPIGKERLINWFKEQYI